MRGEVDESRVPHVAGWQAEHIVPLFRSLEEIAWKANSTLDTDTILQEIVQSVTSHSQWTICWAGLFDETRTRVILHYDSGLWRDVEDPRQWRLDGSPSLVALDRGTPVSLADVRLEDDYPIVQQDARERGFGGVLVIPLRMDGGEGALWLCSAEPHTFTEAEVAFGAVVGSLTAIALNNAQSLRREQLLRATQESQFKKLQEMHLLAERQNDVLSQLSHAHDMLLRIVLGTGGFSALAQAIGTLVDRPTALLDQFSDIVATHALSEDAAFELSSTVGPEAGSSFRRLEALRAGRIDLPTGVAALVSPVVLDGVTFGYLCVMEADEELPEVARRVLEQATLLVALEFLKARIRLDVELSSQRDLAALLDSEHGDEQRLRRRAALLGLNLSSKNQVLRLRVTAWDGDLQKLSSVARLVQQRVQRRDPGCIVLPLDAGDLVVILPCAKERSEASRSMTIAAIRSALAAGLASSRGVTVAGIAVGIGGPASGAAGLRESYQQAARCLHIMAALGREDGELSFSDAGSYALLVALDPVRQEEFLKDVLGRLQAYDDLHKTNLVETLDTYLDSFGSVPRTAAALYLHHTTVRYRLGRIEEIIGASLSEPEIRLSLQIGLRLRRIIHTTTNGATN
jgi:DNA-binding PucR family transcriptional regulator